MCYVIYYVRFTCHSPGLNGISAIVSSTYSDVVAPYRERTPQLRDWLINCDDRLSHLCCAIVLARAMPWGRVLGHTLTWFRKLRASLRSHVTLVLSTLLPRAARVRPDAIVPAMPVGVEAWSGAFLLPNLHRRRPICTAYGRGEKKRSHMPITRTSVACTSLGLGSVACPKAA